MRKVERYGITKSGQQYTGWKQLGSGTPMPAAEMTVEEAARVVKYYSRSFTKGYGSWPSVADLDRQATT